MGRSRDVVEHDEAASKQEAVGVCSQPHPTTAGQYLDNL